jgi:hypothetical protein
MPATNVLAMVVVHSSCLYLQQQHLKQPLPPSLPVSVDELFAFACLVRLFEFMVRLLAFFLIKTWTKNYDIHRSNFQEL